MVEIGTINFFIINIPTGRYVGGGIAMLLERNKNRRKMIFAIALPIMIQNIVMNLQVMIDRAFLGNLDARYLASIGNVMVPFNALNFFFYSAATGLTVLVAQNIGRKDYSRAKKLGESAFVYSTLFSTLLFLTWLLGANIIFTVFGASGEILSDAVTYVRIVAISLIFLGIEVSGGSILQGVGITRHIMVFGILKSLTNILLDWILIYGKFGFPALGLKGAALATMISNIIAAVGIFIAILKSRRLPFTFSKKALLRPKWQLYKKTLEVGMPIGIEALLWYLGQLILVRFLNQIDSMAIGVYSLVNGIQSIPLFIYLGIAKAAMTKVGQYWGDEEYQEALSIGLYCQKLASICVIVFSVAFFIFPRHFAGIFTADVQVLDRAVPLIRLSGIFINVQALNVVMGNAIRATGDTKWMLYSQIAGTIFIVSIAPVMIFGLSLGLKGMYITMIVDEGIRGAINYARFYYGKNPFEKWTSTLKAFVSKT